MGSFNILQFLSLLLLLTSLAVCFSDEGSCKPLKCTEYGPLIKFPFSIKDRHPPHCGYPGYDVFCHDDGSTFIHIAPVNRDLVVDSIDYRKQTLTMISGPKDCFFSLLFNSPNNLSVSPFAFDSQSEYTIVNCSEHVAEFSSYVTKTCLSDMKHDVLAIDASSPVGVIPASCQPTKTAVMPLSYTYIKTYIEYEKTLVINMRWDVPVCRECESRGLECGFKNKSSSDVFCLVHHDKGLKTRYVIAGTIIGTLPLLVATAIGIKVCYSLTLNRKLDLENEIKVEKFLESYKSLKPTRYSYNDLKKITDQFKEKIGQGGFGSVFKGMFPNGTTVAVKILKTFGGDGEEFINEVGTIGTIHHVNVVRLLGFCADRLKRALIYEFMPNESLEKFIFSKNNEDHFLGWEKLQAIAVGVAKGIEYLHQGCDQRILHFDIKPHNILLDQNFNPKISDFGLAKLCSKGKSVVSMAAARGTMGYIAPEVYSRNFGNVSHKSDVYSFGMLLLEMVGGRKNIDVTVEKTSQVYFPEWIYKRLCQGEDMGMSFTTNEDSEIAKKLTIVALWCIQWYPVDRPSMNAVLQMLEGNMESLTMPPDPFVSTSSAKTNLENTHVANLPTISE